jgi:chromosome segregation ATPase
MALADIRFEEKLEAEKKFSVCDGKLIEAEKEIVKIEAVSESQKALICQLQCENNENTCKISEMNSRIKVMQINFDGKSLADSKRIDELNCHLTQVRECLNVAEEKNSSWNEKHSRLFDDHREAETLLEDVMFKLISFADLYSTMENKFEREKTILSENLLSSERALDETQKKYQSSEEKADSYKEKNQELKQAYDKLKRKSKTINSDKTRKPMGTLAFMNSLQDNSISSVRRTKSTNKERQMQPKENEYVPNSERRSALRTNDTRRNFRIKKR